MITIKKYPNRRMYNTHTSTYINLAGIQSLIEAGEDVQILDSKSNVDVTTQTLLLHAFDAETLELLVPSMKMQALMRLSTAERQQIIRQEMDVLAEPDSETQNDEVTQPVIQPNAESVSDVEMATPTVAVDGGSVEPVSESSEDSDSEITIVRVKAPPSTPPSTSQSSERSMESLLDATPLQEAVDEGSFVQESTVQQPLDIQSSDGGVDGIPSFWSDGEPLNEWEGSSESFSEDESGSYSPSEDSSSLSSQTNNPDWNVHTQQSEDSQGDVGDEGKEVNDLKDIKEFKEEMIDDEGPSVETPIAISVLESEGVDSERNDDEVHASITFKEKAQDPNVYEWHLTPPVDGGSDSVNQSDKESVDSSVLSNTESSNADSSNTVSNTPISKKSTDEMKTPVDAMDERAAQMKARLEQMKARLRR